MSTAIVCLGNRFVPGDDIGCRVYDHLAGTQMPEGVELIDGGLAGLDLLRLMEGRHRVVFADAVMGMATAGEIVVLNRAQVAAYAGTYGHGAGLPYLLHLLPRICSAPLPEIALVGAESPEGTADETTVRALATRCLEVAADGAP